METTRQDRRRAACEARADATRRAALSPFRILLRVAGIPLIAVALTVSIYLRVSDYPPEDAIRHLYALAGCDAAASVGLAPAWEGRLGYHPRNDPDADGVACGSGLAATASPAAPATTTTASAPDPEAGPRMTGGAKFLRP